MQAGITYNWDDIEVGRFDLNHSENFFTEKHFKHEKFSREFNLAKMEAANLNESFSSKIAIECGEDKENAKPLANQLENLTVDPLLQTNQIKSESEEQQPVKLESEKQKPVKLECELQKPLQIEGGLQPTNAKTPATILASNGNRRPANLLTRPKTPQLQAKSKVGPQPVSGKSGKTLKMEPPHAYDFKDIYQKKKDEKMKKLLEDERKNRIFHCRPVPKSVTMPSEPLPRKANSDYKLTTPVTPVVLKNSKEADEKRMQRIAEWKKRNQPFKFTSREAMVLQEEPFRPKKSGQVVQMQPFNLHVERRIEERKQYDEQNKRAAEEKKKQEEEERKKREEEMVKEIRKLATFKARPNPFK